MASHIAYDTQGNKIDTSLHAGQNAGLTPSVPSPQVDKSNYSTWDGNWLGYLEYMADNGDKGAQDKLFDYLIGKTQREEENAYTRSREDTMYQRFAEDARKAGFNPAALLNLGASPASASASSSSSFSGSQFTTQSANKKTTESNILRGLLTAFVSLVGIAVMAL